MKTYTYSQARQRLASLLDEARREGKVQIRRQDGSTFLLQPVTDDRSPLDVPGVRSRLRPGELVAIIRAERERSAPVPRDRRRSAAPPRARRRTKPGG